MNISVVIICKNGSALMADTLASVQEIGNEILSTTPEVPIILFNWQKRMVQLLPWVRGKDMDVTCTKLLYLQRTIGY